MASILTSLYDKIVCGSCNNIYSQPHSLSCSHVFCLSPCILSFKREKGRIFCPSCGEASEFKSIKHDEVVANAVKIFKLKNKSVELSACPNCHRGCSSCELCNHCDRYLCSECLNSHKTTYSSVLFSRLLDLKLRCNRLKNPEFDSRFGYSKDAIERLKQIIEKSLLQAEICLETLEILLNDISSDTPRLELTEITNLIESNERKRDVCKSISQTVSEFANSNSSSALNIQLNANSFVK